MLKLHNLKTIYHPCLLPWKFYLCCYGVKIIEFNLYECINELDMFDDRKSASMIIIYTYMSFTYTIKETEYLYWIIWNSGFVPRTMMII